MLRVFTTTILLSISLSLFGQFAKGNGGEVILINLSYGVDIPGADMADRFGTSFQAGGGFDYMTKNNLIFGARGNLIFGNRVEENPLAQLEDEGGNVFGTNGEPSNFSLRERGIYVGGHIGKLFSLSETNKRSGIRVTVGAGLLQHKIRVQDDPQSNVPIIAGDYKLGWDKLSNGLAFSEFIGYQLMSKNRRINLMLGLEFTQGRTQNRRNLDFDTQERDETIRTDLLYGFKVVWSLPIYFNSNADQIYY